LLASWNPGLLANIPEGSGLTMRLREASEPNETNYFADFYNRQTREIRSTRFDIDMAQDRIAGWRETKGNKQVLSSDKVADIWANSFFVEVEKRIKAQ
jgi:hypothetical protein